jgi:uncharacterized membrane protein (UPF0127 family)
MKFVKVRNISSPDAAVTVKYCDTFFSKLLGLMFSKTLDQNFGLIIIEEDETRINTAIHMLFMNYDITVLWLDKDWVVVDKVLAKKWAPIYIPKKPAQFILELHYSKFSEYSIGDKLELVDEV